MKLDKDIYQELIKNIDIRQVNLKNLSVESSNKIEQENIKISVSHDVIKYEREKDKFSVLTEFEVQGLIEEQKVFNIYFILELSYSLEASITFEEQYIDFFTKNNVPVNAWPYARELVSNLTLRMGLSALILPVLRV
ncbi:protein-export chaperone SecB [Lysinibacillus sp. NPDC096212]|uniref:protein-export chaperone SecB n=1 Tax=Lysinibacillus sp. NPDC096212 TaxID=3364135 RepID=UPI00380626BB